MRSSFEKPTTKASLLSTMVTSTSSGTPWDNTVASSRPAKPAPSMSTFFIESPFPRESATVRQIRSCEAAEVLHARPRTGLSIRPGSAPLRSALWPQLEPLEGARVSPLGQEPEEGHWAFAVGAADESVGGGLALVVVVAGRALLLEGADVSG